MVPSVRHTDLQEYESSILGIANAEGIDVAVKVTLAQQDLANELMLFLFRRAPFRDYQPNFRRSRGLADVVVTDALRQWHIHKTLALVYRDAYYNQLNDRYQGKWNEYEQLAKGKLADVLSDRGRCGCGPDSESADCPCCPVFRGVAPRRHFTLLRPGSMRPGKKALRAPIQQLSTAAGEDLVVTLTGPPQNAVGWNVYVGLSPGTLTRQNDTPLAPGSSWTMTGALSSGRTAHDGAAAGLVHRGSPCH